MIDHDRHVGQLLALMDELGIAEDTFVMYSTDNGAHMNSWPDAAMTPFRNEKASNWEGAFRVPMVVRWPGKIPASVVSNDIVQHHDWLPTLLAMAGEPDDREKLQGHKAGDKTFRVHLDGYNLLDFLTKEGVRSPRQGFIYFSDDGDLVGLRMRNWKIVFLEQRCQGTLQIRAEPFTTLRLPELFNYEPIHHEGRCNVEYLLGLGPCQVARHPRQPSHRGRLPRHLQRLSASAKGGQLHHRPGPRKDDGERRRPLKDVLSAGARRQDQFDGL